MKWSHRTATAIGYYYKKDKKRNGKHRNKENLKLFALVETK